MTRRLVSLLPIFALAALQAACQPNIGDDCRTSIDCSPAGDRLCDVTQPGGYCTQFNCEPGTCPDDANCIAFDEQLAVQPECRDDNGVTRYTRSYCMEMCKNNDDCRPEYVCEDLRKTPNRLNALVIDSGRSGKVCIAAYTSRDILTDPDAPSRETGVCTGVGAEGGAPNGD